MRLSPIFRSAPYREIAMVYGHDLDERAAIDSKFKYLLRSGNTPDNKLWRRSLCQVFKELAVVNRYGDWTRSVPDEMKKYTCCVEEIEGIGWNDFEEGCARRRVRFEPEIAAKILIAQ